MPTYTYKFIDTGETIEVRQSFTDDSLTEYAHPASGETLAVKKVFSPVGVTFKGDGFYKNDSRAAAKSKSKSSGSSDGGDSGSSSDSASSGESSSGSSDKRSDSKGSDSKSSESKGSESKGSESKSSESKSSDSKASAGSSGSTSRD